MYCISFAEHHSEIENLTMLCNFSESTHSDTSDKVCSDANVSNTPLIAVLAVSLVVNVFLGIVVALLWNKMKR